METITVAGQQIEIWRGENGGWFGSIHREGTKIIFGASETRERVVAVLSEDAHEIERGRAEAERLAEYDADAKREAERALADIENWR
jgi:hypothetical protein